MSIIKAAIIGSLIGAVIGFVYQVIVNKKNKQ